MTLHELYEKLIARGMPKHPNLVWDVRHDEITGVDSSEWGLCTDTLRAPEDGVEEVIVGPNMLSDEIVRDLLAMHAMRWWQSLPVKNPNAPPRPLPGHYTLNHAGTTLLETIVYSTARLETP